MKNLPDIDPEFLGLLEEIVADPRSAMRLVPRKALRSWFDTGETARASEISTTRAERHLIDEHRESLAALLCEAAWIAYWKAPVLAHRPANAEGLLFDPTEREPAWKRKAERYAARPPAADEGLGLLRQALTGLRADSAHQLAMASLHLAPSDRTRCYSALTIPWSQPRSAVRFFRRLSEMAWPKTLRAQALESLGARLCSMHLFSEARDAYRAQAQASPDSPYGHICALTLSCVLGDESGAVEEARRLSETVRSTDECLMEEVALLRTWSATLSREALASARRARSRIVHDLLEVGKTITGAFES